MPITVLISFAGALLMEGYLDEGERSMYMDFDSTIGTETKSQYNVVCQ